MSLFNEKKLISFWHDNKELLFYFTRRVRREQIQVVAGYLSYVCLMSLVPLIVVMLSVMTAFPLFAELQQSIEQFVYQNFVPAAGDVVQQYLTGFVANASKMSAVAISFLFLAALLLISSIDNTFNKIWRVTDKRRTITSFAMYWMVLTLGPILVGASIALSSYLVSIVAVDEYDVLGLSDMFLRMLPLLSSIIAFIILYIAVPNKAVPFRFALSGAIVAGVLFELAKKAFALYITAFPSYQVIYGALATIPIIFLWVYVSWIIVLTGALITVSLQEYEILKEKKVNETDRAQVKDEEIS
ncbi:virulence factor BrkB family protein [Colwellia sp. Bg11-28]|uniref:virulence factor BrkB family protein n=1 Tax=Colwellia sp. Bg11-28 TaxID=2058305 RepID=UPI001E4DAD91|nr:virulence factor BrkB family protein [Colwellia sp. Bg11-28]